MWLGNVVQTAIKISFLHKINGILHSYIIFINSVIFFFFMTKPHIFHVSSRGMWWGPILLIEQFKYSLIWLFFFSNSKTYFTNIQNLNLWKVIINVENNLTQFLVNKLIWLEKELKHTKKFYLDLANLTFYVSYTFFSLILKKNVINVF